MLVVRVLLLVWVRMRDMVVVVVERVMHRRKQLGLVLDWRGSSNRSSDAAASKSCGEWTVESMGGGAAADSWRGWLRARCTSRVTHQCARAERRLQ
jgi:hypothetical protein